MYALLFTALLWFSSCFSMEKVQVMPAVHTDVARELADKFLEAADARAVEQIISAYQAEQWLPAFAVFGRSNPLSDTTGNFYVKLEALIKKIWEGNLLEKLSSDDVEVVEVIENYAAAKARGQATYSGALEEASQGEQERIQQEEQHSVKAMRRESERIQREQERKQEAVRRDLAETLKRSLTAQRRSTEVSLNQAEALANVILKDDRSLEDVEETLANEEVSLWVPCFTLYGKMIPEHDLTGLYYEKLEWLIGAIEKKKQEIDQAQYREFKDVSMRMLQGRAEREQEYAEKLKKIKAEKEESRKDAEARLAAEAKRAQEEKQKLEAKKARQKAEEEEVRRKKEQERSGTKGQDEALQQKLAERRVKAEAGKMAPLDRQNSPENADLKAKQSQEKAEASHMISKLDEVSRIDSSAVPARSIPPSIASPVVNGRVSPRAEGIGRGASEQRANESLRELREELDRLKQENGNLPEIKKTFDNELRKARLEVESIRAQLTRKFTNSLKRNKNKKISAFALVWS